MSLLLGGACIVFALLAPYWFPPIFGWAICVIATIVGMIALFIAAAGSMVIARYFRMERGEEDFFLRANRSRDANVILATPPMHRTTIRRWLAQKILGHDLIVGDLVEIRSWAEIQSTLDKNGCLEGLPFMPEMLSMCGKQARVFRSMNRLFDYRKTRKMRHMDGAVLLVDTVCDGSSHGGCEAACHTIWKSDWLRRVDLSISPKETVRDHRSDRGSGDFSKEVRSPLEWGTRPPNYSCQLTQLNAASMPIGKRSFVNFLRPIVAGNVTLRGFVIGWMTHLFNVVQHKRQGVSFPEIDVEVKDLARIPELSLNVGDKVFVRGLKEIRSTLNAKLEHRGMGFEDDMLKYCGQPLYVHSEIKKLIDIVTGEMRTMKTPAYYLRGIHFSGERQQFNAQWEPLFWRSVWLRREDQ